MNGARFPQQHTGKLFDPEAELEGKMQDVSKRALQWYYKY
jgi:hypothetical protein